MQVLSSETQIQTLHLEKKETLKPDVSVCQTIYLDISILMLVPERDSPRDQLVVTLFLLTVFGLLLGAGIKNRMLKAGLTGAIFPWNRRREEERWWEVCLLDTSSPCFR